jgi:hypothetical protein
MASDAQISANRANSQFSTGPTTPAGIDNCKHNATRHGLTGRQIVVRGEDPAAYDALRSQLIAEHTPASELEAMLVEELAQNFWRLERARRCETQMLENMDLAAAMSDRAFSNLQRYTARIERNFARARKDLAALQDARRKQQAKDNKAATARSFIQSLASRPDPRIGSVLSPVFAAPAAAPAPGGKKAA